MKILVLGDIHGKTHWKNIIEKGRTKEKKYATI